MKSIAAQVREQKERRPEMYCRAPGCLFRIQTRNGATPCPKHPVAPIAETTVTQGESRA